MKFVNLTPHTIKVFNPETGDMKEFTSSGVARVDSKSGRRMEDLSGCQVFGPDLVGKVTGLPEYDPLEDWIYIVSAVVGASVRGRRDVVVPGTGPMDNPIRENGQIVAVTRFKFVD